MGVLLLPFTLLFLPFLLLRVFIKTIVMLIALPFAFLAVAFALLLAFAAVLFALMIPLLPIVFVVFCLWVIVRLASRPVLSH